MPVYKDTTQNTWRSVIRFTDWQGNRKQTQKRGFKTKHEAQAWEREQLAKTKADLDMTFGGFVELYLNDIKNRVKENTWLTKENIIQSKILPYFKNQKIRDIQSKDIIAWQNEMLSQKDKNGNPYSPVYLRTINNQLSAIFNHAVRYYDLSVNPVVKTGGMGKKKNKEMQIWTQGEYLKFADVMMENPRYYYAFEMLYWCGIRVGELLALTPSDFDFAKKTLSITKSYQRLKGKDVISDPKTENSNRVIQMPDFLVEEMKDYINMLYCVKPHDRLFELSKNGLGKKIKDGAKAACLKQIRIHDLRHSHVSLLIEMGFSAVAIGSRLGHKSVDITYNYAHLFPTTQDKLAETLDNIRDIRKEED